MTAQTNTTKLPAKTKWFYGIGDIGNAVVNSAIQFFLMKFYTDGALIAPALAGNALLIGKIWDAINDPIFGWFTDKTKSKYGKRRVFMIFGAIPLAIAIALLWQMPTQDKVWAFVWIALTFILFDTIWTMTNVPYYALTSELTEDYDERSSLTTYRFAMAVPAYLIGAALTPAIVGLFAIQKTGYGFIGIAYGILAGVALLISAAGIRERTGLVTAKPEASPFKSLGIALKNKPFVWLCIVYFITNISFALIKTLMAYFIEYQMLMKEQISLFMGLLLICVTISLPIWRWIGQKIDMSTFLLPHEPSNLVYLVSILAGFGFGAQWIYSWAMVADVADYDRAETGQQRSGMYYGVWGLATKISEALALASVGWILSGYGYVANVEQTPHALFGIRLFFCIVPGIFIFAALPMLFKYPLTRAKHAEIRAKLDAMDAAAMKKGKTE
jgi:GPH family glycoside/pentoside/hexuronide:cation symporter